MQILGVKGAYFEMRRQPPKLNRIHEILSQNYYEGEEFENSDFHILNEKVSVFKLKILCSVNYKVGNLFNSLAKLKTSLEIII